MTPEKQRIKIAEACGWKQKSSHFGGWEGIWVNSEGCESTTIPDYFTDLNAMHEAEKRLHTLNPYFIGIYQDWIKRIVPNSPAYAGGSFAIIHATAAQRAEAFLRTLGLWEEEQ